MKCSIALSSYGCKHTQNCKSKWLQSFKYIILEDYIFPVILSLFRKPLGCLFWNYSHFYGGEKRCNVLLLGENQDMIIKSSSDNEEIVVGGGYHIFNQTRNKCCLWSCWKDHATGLWILKIFSQEYLKPRIFHQEGRTSWIPESSVILLHGHTKQMEVEKKADSLIIHH